MVGCWVGQSHRRFLQGRAATSNAIFIIIIIIAECRATTTTTTTTTTTIMKIWTGMVVACGWNRYCGGPCLGHELHICCLQKIRWCRRCGRTTTTSGCASPSWTTTSGYGRHCGCRKWQENQPPQQRRLSAARMMA
jgi:hypothetical protein